MNKVVKLSQSSVTSRWMRQRYKNETSHNDQTPGDMQQNCMALASVIELLLCTQQYQWVSL
jgi:hypothetical protein